MSQQRAKERRERARMSAEEVIRVVLNERLERIARAMLDKVEETGNPAGFTGLWDRGYGPPAQRQEIEDVTERSADVQADLAELERLDRELKARKAA